MTSARFDQARIQDLLERAGRELSGSWVLVGGGAAAAWFHAGRTTEDVDLVAVDGSLVERHALMQLAANAGLPIEAVNSAADYFLRKVTDWRDQLVELHRGPSAVIYRPNATLFLLLKLGRLSEIDLDDCVRLLAHAAQHGELVDGARVRAALDALPATDADALAARRTTLRAHLP